MRSLCLFAAYFEGTDLPYYITVYLLELKKNCSDLVFLCHTKDLSEASKGFLKSENIELQVENNEGFDFGLWYKAIKKRSLNSYDRLVLVNDSCILFRSLTPFMKWCDSASADLKGMTLSESIKPHIQSYFLVVEKKAIGPTIEYFDRHKVMKDLKEVIHTYEIGLSSFLISKGQSIAAFVDNNGYKGEHAPYYYCADHHLEAGIPLVKKKTYFNSFRPDELMSLARMGFRMDREHYKTMINGSGKDLIIDLDKLEKDKAGELGIFSKLRFVLLKFSVKMFRSVKNMTR